MLNVQDPNINFDKFLSHLQQEFERRCRINKSYSLRSYARSLNIHASCLSVILRGKRPLTHKLVKRFCLALNLSGEELRSLVTSPERKTERGDYAEISLDIISLISDWKHDAILELIKMENFVSDYQWVANCLEVSVMESKLAVERLIRLGLVRDVQGEWMLTHENIDFMIDEYTTMALKSYQIHALELSKRAIENVEIENRYHGTMVMAIDNDKVSEAKEMLREFKRKFCSDLQNQKNMNQIYQLNLGFYPISKVGELQ